jgi:hypothetical protein
MQELAMSATRSIEIDFDVHKLIEQERVSFSDTPNETLRRLLGIETLVSDKPKNTPAQHIVETKSMSFKSWQDAGVVLPHGTELRMEYRGKSYFGEIDNGLWVVEGTKFDSPSPAAMAVARTKEGKVPSVNGWKYWEARMPQSNRWVNIKSLRDL